MDHADAVAVTVVHSARAGDVWERVLQLPAGATVRDALHASGVLQEFVQIDLATSRVGVWGKFCEPDRVLRDRDRVEIYRPLTVDPKEARRVRYRAHRLRYGGK
jgi:putative ubiquitin-RnfH superfamily antitoxin RatB of RatAB toxin-antitoxin module